MLTPSALRLFLPSVLPKQDTLGASDCRVELVCARCQIDCDDIPSSIEIDESETPVCETVPTGVHVSRGVTLEDFNLTEGYYRVSNKSKTVLECYQPVACIGGIDSTNYCANGYEGPCELSMRDIHHA